MSQRFMLQLGHGCVLAVLAAVAQAAPRQTDHFLFAGAARAYNLNADPDDPHRSDAGAMESFDLDGDGDRDLVQFEDCPSSFTLIENRGGTLVRMGEIPLDDLFTSSHRNLVAGDVNG